MRTPAAGIARTPTARTALAFWGAAAAGFLLHGGLVASAAAHALGDPAPFATGDVALAALQLGVLEAFVLGAPLAWLFAFGAGGDGERWLRPIGAASALAVALACVLAVAGAAVGAGWAALPALHAAAAVAIVLAGAAAGVLVQRRRR